MGLLSGLKEKIVQYIDVYVKLFKISFIERTAGLLSYLMFALIALLISFCIILFLGFGLTELFILAGLSKALSFFITIAVYLLTLVIVVMCRRSITGFFAGEIVKVMTEDDEADDSSRTA